MAILLLFAGGGVASWLGSYVGGIRQWFVPLQKKIKYLWSEWCARSAVS